MILPGATVGVLGGGQLGRMFAFRAHELGYRVVVLDPHPESPAGTVADEHIRANYDDQRALARLAESCAAVTTEFENVPAATLEFLAERRPVSPPATAVAVAQDRVREKSHMAAAGLATARFVAVGGKADARAAFAELGVPAILKTNRLGYDGKGQRLVDSARECEAAFEELGGVDCILEERLELEGELSVILARGRDGKSVSYPPGANVHRDGILYSTVVPAPVSPRMEQQARELAHAVADSLEYVGVLGVELFQANGGQLYVNEIAPRPHNSGHYTIDAAATDQFEQQLRALCGLPLGSTRLLSPVAMINLLGDLWTSAPPHWDRALAVPGVRLHLYGKSEPRPGRKMGHLTCVAETAAAALAGAQQAYAALQ